MWSSVWRRRPADAQHINSATLTVLFTALPALAAIAYTILRVSYDLFYNSFGLSTQEVGIGQGELLVRSVGGLVATLLIAAWLSSSLIAITLWAFFRLRSPAKAPTVVTADTLFRWMTAGFIVVQLAILLVFLPLQASRLAERVHAGTPIRANVFSTAGLAITTSRAQYRFIDEPTSTRDGQVQDAQREYLLLGQAKGTYILYDYASNRTVRIPESSVIVEVAGASAPQLPVIPVVFGFLLILVTLPLPLRLVRSLVEENYDALRQR